MLWKTGLIFVYTAPVPSLSSVCCDEASTGGREGRPAVCKVLRSAGDEVEEVDGLSVSRELSELSLLVCSPALLARPVPSNCLVHSSSSFTSSDTLDMGNGSS